MPAPTSPLRSLLWRAKEARPEWWPGRVRRALFIVRARAIAAYHRASLELELAPDVLVGRQVSIEVMPRTVNRITIGPGGRIHDRVLLRLGGGTIDFGPGCELRRDCIVNMGGGHLELVRRNIFSWGCRIHCAEHVRLEPLAGVAEDCTVADSSHYYTEPDTWFYDNTRTAPVHIGANTWLCPKVSVTSGVRIGDHCIIGAGSVVVADVPDGHLASGVPASVRPMTLPWQQVLADAQA